MQMLSERIREATKPAHLKLEKIVVQQLKDISDNESYAAFLNKFFIYFSKVEKVIAPYVTIGLLPDFHERRNSQFLKRDIETLGFEVTDKEKTEVPIITDLISALGALYVMEGSIMGGKIIVQMLEKLGITSGTTFFSGYGPETGRKWAVFTEVMNNAAPSQEEEDQAIKAANQTFELFEKVFV